jgi:hypothetical protein
MIRALFVMLFLPFATAPWLGARTQAADLGPLGPSPYEVVRGGPGKGPGQFSGVHAVAVGPEGRIFALDRSAGRIHEGADKALLIRPPWVASRPR